MVDEIEQAVVGPVEVFEDEHDRTHCSQPFEETPPGEKGLRPPVMPGTALAREPDEGAEVSLHPLGFGIVPKRLAHGALELLGGRRRRLPLEDPGVRLDDLAERPERHARAVRDAASLEPGGLVGAPAELLDEPRLALAGAGDQRRESRGMCAPNIGQRRVERLQLAMPAHEWSSVQTRVPDIASQSNGLPDGYRARLPLRQHGLGLAVLDDVLGRPVRLLADDDPVHRSRRLQPRGRVDDVARGHRLAHGRFRADAHERLAGVHGNSQLKLLFFAPDPVTDRQCCSDGSLGITLS